MKNEIMETILEALAEKINRQETDICLYKWQLDELKAKLAKAEDEINKHAENQRKDVMGE